jgi:hypothetical protein
VGAAATVLSYVDEFGGGEAERVATSSVGRLLGRFLTRRAHASTPGLNWKVTRGPAFGNTLGELTLDGRSLEVSVSAACSGPALRQAWTAGFAA